MEGSPLSRRALRRTALALALAGLAALPASVAPARPPAVPPPQLASLAPLVDAVKGAVVNVEVVARATAEDLEDEDGAPGGPSQEGRGGGGEERGGPGGRAPGRPPMLHGAGSGFIVDARGLVVTNDHVVKGATRIRVRLEDGRSFEAEVAGRDPPSDVAVIRLRGEVGRLPAVELGDSEALRVGDWVVAIGNPFGLASSVSAGIISAKARDLGAGPYDDYLQTDAAINPGNSGGPLFDLSGRVVGMSTAIVGGGAGIGFAVPSGILRLLLPQLERGQAVARGFLGATVQDLTPELGRALASSARQGAVVADVLPGGPGAQAGLRPDDVVTAVDGRPVTSANALTRAVAFGAPGSTTVLRVQRAGQALDLRVKLGRRPAEEGDEEPAAEADQGQQRERFGLAFRDPDPRAARREGAPAHGALVTAVRAGSPAEDAGLQPGMVVVEAGGRPVARAADLAAVLRAARPGSVVLLRVQLREGRVLAALQVPRAER